MANAGCEARLKRRSSFVSHSNEDPHTDRLGFQVKHDEPPPFRFTLEKHDGQMCGLPRRNTTGYWYFLYGLSLLPRFLPLDPYRETSQLFLQVWQCYPRRRKYTSFSYRCIGCSYHSKSVVLSYGRESVWSPFTLQRRNVLTFEIGRLHSSKSDSGTPLWKLWRRSMAKWEWYRHGDSVQGGSVLSVA